MKKKTILLGALASCLLIFLVWDLGREQSDIAIEEWRGIEKNLAVLTKEERKQLRGLFERFFFFEGFAYTVFGSKPMSIGGLLPTAEERMAWTGWEKVAPLFESEQFVIRKYVFNNKEFVLVANLGEIERVYEKDKEILSQTLGRLVSLDELKRCLRQDDSLFKAVMSNHLALGILLGYGKGNAQLFADNFKISGEGKYSLSPFCSSHPVFYFFSPTMPPCFACDPHSTETRELTVRYKEEREHIARLAKRGSLFDRMLVALSKTTIQGKRK